MATRLLPALALAPALLLAPGLASAKVDEALAEDIRHLMELTGTADIAARLGAAVERQTVAALQRANPEAGGEAERIVAEVVSEHIAEAEGAEALVSDVVAIYAETFSHEEIRRLIEFYETPLGEKVANEMPQVVGRAMRAGQEWARERMPALQQDLRSRLESAGLWPQPSGSQAPGGAPPSRRGPGGGMGGSPEAAPVP